MTVRVNTRNVHLSDIDIEETHLAWTVSEFTHLFFVSGKFTIKLSDLDFDGGHSSIGLSKP